MIRLLWALNIMIYDNMNFVIMATCMSEFILTLSPQLVSRDG